jgi:hypothetical protein
MSHRCPSCNASVDLAGLVPLGDAGVLRCQACGHSWAPAKLEPAAAPPEPEIHRLLGQARAAEEVFLARRRKKRATAAAWIALGLVALSPGAFALAFPERIVAAAPGAIALYDWMGREVNIYGLEIRSVELQHLLTEGQQVIAVKGEIVNVTGEARKIPWLRFGLADGEGAEVYQWQLDTEQRPLRPGEAKNFVTRIASPPQGAVKLQIRFARADEIGSNAGP